MVHFPTSPSIWSPPLSNSYPTSCFFDSYLAGKYLDQRGRERTSDAFSWSETWARVTVKVYLVEGVLHEESDACSNSSEWVEVTKLVSTSGRHAIASDFDLDAIEIISCAL